MIDTRDPKARKDLEEKLRQIGGAYIRPGPFFKKVCLDAMRRRYPNGMPDAKHHAAAIWDFMFGWAYGLTENRETAGISNALCRFKHEIGQLGIMDENWQPDATWRWW